MSESTQHKLDRNRPPRVQITYDVEIGDSVQKKELPFVVGIMSDLSGQPKEPLPKVKDRKFVDIDRDNFNDVMASISPHLKIAVDNKLEGEDSEINVELNFAHFDDFSPANLMRQVAPLRKLYEARRKLSDLISKLDGNDELEKLLHDIIGNTETLKEIQAAAGKNERPIPERKIPDGGENGK